MLWALGFAALAAVVVGIATRVVITQSGKLATAQAALSDEKERLLKVDLKQKDVEIGTLKLRSDTAETGIAAAKADASIAAAKAAAAIAEQQQVQIDLAKQQNRAAKAERDLLEVKESLKQRRFTKEQSDFLVTVAKRFPGQQISFAKYGLDFEAQAFSDRIDAVLRLAGWHTTNDATVSGVDMDKGIVFFVENGTRSDAVEAMVVALNGLGFQSSVGLRTRFDPTPLPPGCVGIFVGSKP